VVPWNVEDVFCGWNGLEDDAANDDDDDDDDDDDAT
jgi:hypothetical protein